MVRRNQQKLSNEFSFLTFKNKNLRNKNKIVSSLQTFLYHCLSKSAMYKQEKRLFQITLLEQPLPIK
jgi:hypothetical protein